MSAGENTSTNEAGAKPVSLVEHFTRSESFSVLFTSGMELVEETADFLDNDGRAAINKLPEAAKALYGTESMRLTTRLMQMASWLLLQRAVAEGEMSVEQAMNEKQNVKLSQIPPRVEGDTWEHLPEKFVALVERSISLQQRIRRLDTEIYTDDLKPGDQPADNPVAAQLGLLKTAFGND
ncbi:DUF1465 family protein [Pseudahrensia aquimaris]|uniref:DUF1465 family protein n=1 Tax=Pseudahrensia aquimaris TaxID=744461 RepID=A0ABW3FEB5_9HYPH